MADIRIQIGDKNEVVQAERLAATEEFAQRLRSSGLAVELEVVEPEPGRRGLTPVEWTAIFIGTNVATSVISNVTGDLYEAAKGLLRARREAKKQQGHAGRHLGFTIQGPNDEELCRWSTRDEEADESNSD